jgi:transcriptional regulator with XRE-family HTH domain
MPSTITTDTPDGPRRRGRFIDGATFGAFLQNHREGRNLSLDDIATDTKIATRHLTALERGDVRSWPGGLYRRAMVRAYATAVGLDPDVTVTEFTEAFDDAPLPVEPDTRPTSTIPLHAVLAIRPGASVYLGLAVCATIGVLGWAATSSDAASSMQARVDVSAARPSTIARDALSTVEGRNPSYVTAADTFVVNAAALRNRSVEAAVQNASNVEPAERVEGSLRIVSEPAGADVTVNGIRRGHTPVTVRYLAHGQKRVRVSMQGYTSEERLLDLTTARPAQAIRVVLDAAP